MPDWGGEAGFWIKNVVADVLLYPTSPMIAIALGLAFRRSRPRAGPALAWLGVVVLWVFSLPIVVNALAAGDERAYPPFDPSTPLPPHTAIVALSGGAQLGATDWDGETINAITLNRVRSTARLAARTKLPILVSGGRLPSARGSEAKGMADALTGEFGTPVRWIEDRSLDTAENARRSAPLLKADGFDHALLVTDVSHMRRAKALFEAAGIAVTPAPTDYYANGPVNVLSFLPSGNAMRRSAWAMHERLGLLWTSIRH